jgi:hypothetical protein
MVRTRDGVVPLLVDKVAASGVSSVSQYVADLLAIHVGLSALVRELNQAAVADSAARTVAPLRGDRLMIRPRREVSERLAHLAAEAGYPQAGCRQIAVEICRPRNWRGTGASHDLLEIAKAEGASAGLGCRRRT